MKNFLVALSLKKVLIISITCVSLIAGASIVVPSVLLKNDDNSNKIENTSVLNQVKETNDKVEDKDIELDVLDDNNVTETKSFVSFNKNVEETTGFNETKKNDNSGISKEEENVSQTTPSKEDKEELPNVEEDEPSPSIPEEPEQELVPVEPEKEPEEEEKELSPVEKEDEKTPEVTPDTKEPEVNETKPSESEVVPSTPEVVEPEVTTPTEDKEKIPTEPEIKTEEEEQVPVEKEEEKVPEITPEENEVKPSESEVVPSTPEVTTPEEEKEELPNVEENEPNPSVPEEPKEDLVPTEPEKEPVVSDEKANEPEVVPSIPEVVEPEITEQAPTTPKEEQVEKEELPKQFNDSVVNNELIELIQNAVRKVREANSLQYRIEYSGLYTDNYRVWYNKNQNRRLLKVYNIVNGQHLYNIEEYTEGVAGNYTDKYNGSSSYQTQWRRENSTAEWENRGKFYSGFGINILRFLNNVKNVEEKKPTSGRYAYPTYTVTIDKDVANQVAEMEFNKVNMFNQDVTLMVSLYYDGYIALISTDFAKDAYNDLNNQIKATVSLGYYNDVNVERPEGLKDIEIKPVPEKEDTLTATEKRNIIEEIKNAYKKTYNANSATYLLNGEKVQYDLYHNTALVETDDKITYYKGTDGLYVDHNYVTPTYHQDSWTMVKGTDVWNKNVRKHTCFIPKELYFLTEIFDLSKVEEKDGITTYTIEVLKNNANNAYSYSYNESNHFSSNITFTVSIDEYGYVREIHINQDDYKMDLVIYDIEATEVVEPVGIQK